MLWFTEILCLTGFPGFNVDVECDHN